MSVNSASVRFGSVYLMVSQSGAENHQAALDALESRRMAEISQAKANLEEGQRSGNVFITRLSNRSSSSATETQDRLVKARSATAETMACVVNDIAVAVKAITVSETPYLVGATGQMDVDWLNALPDSFSGEKRNSRFSVAERPVLANAPKQKKDKPLKWLSLLKNKFKKQIKKKTDTRSSASDRKPSLSNLPTPAQSGNQQLFPKLRIAPEQPGCFKTITSAEQLVGETPQLPY
jgi:hypothetical protein